MKAEGGGEAGTLATWRPQTLRSRDEARGTGEAHLEKQVLGRDKKAGPLRPVLLHPWPQSQGSLPPKSPLPRFPCQDHSGLDVRPSPRLTSLPPSPLPSLFASCSLPPAFLNHPCSLLPGPRLFALLCFPLHGGGSQPSASFLSRGLLMLGCSLASPCPGRAESGVFPPTGPAAA